MIPYCLNTVYPILSFLTGGKFYSILVTRIHKGLYEYIDANVHVYSDVNLDTYMYVYIAEHENVNINVYEYENTYIQLFFHGQPPKKRN